jgi:hypothetical protein
MHDVHRAGNLTILVRIKWMRLPGTSTVFLEKYEYIFHTAVQNSTLAVYD